MVISTFFWLGLCFLVQQAAQPLTWYSTRLLPTLFHIIRAGWPDDLPNEECRPEREILLSRHKAGFALVHYR